MLKKIHRLPATQKSRKPLLFKAQNFTLRVSENNLLVSRFGFIVKKSVDRRAVVRNRLRRVFRSCIEDMFEEVKTGYDMLFFLEKGIIDKKREFVYGDIHKLLAERELLK